MSTAFSNKIPIRSRARKKILKAVRSKGRIGDRAITDYNLAKEFGWTFEEIDKSDPKRLSELFVVMRELSDERKRNNDKINRESKKRKRGRK